MTHESICLPTESVCRKKVSNAELAKRLDALERTCEIIYEVMEQMLQARALRRNPIGFRAKHRKKRKATPPKENAA